MTTQVLKLVLDMVDAKFNYDPTTGDVTAVADFVTDASVASFGDNTPQVTMKITFPKGSSSNLRLTKRFTLTIDEGDEVNDPATQLILTPGTPIPKP